MSTEYLDALAETVIDEYEFELPCELKTRKRTCPEPAEWWVVFKSHHSAGGRFEQMLCAKHYENVMAGGIGRCKVCGGAVVFRDNIIRIERLKP